MAQFIRWFEELRASNTPIVGGKNASLGEMYSSLKNEGILVPNGFATTADAYWEFLDRNHFREKISDELEKWKGNESELPTVAKHIRTLLLSGTFSEEFLQELRSAYQKLSKFSHQKTADVAVRSSATAEDLPTASFAGQQETYLNIVGFESLVEALRKCYASLFTDRAIVYRKAQGFDHLKVALSVGVQKMVRADLSGSGVMFTLDPETGFPDVVVINAAWGLGENVVQGTVSPDEYLVFKPLLNDEKVLPILEKAKGEKEKKLIYTKNHQTKNISTPKKQREQFVLSNEEIISLAKWATIIEKHYKQGMDIEWAKDRKNGKLYIVQARPETVQSQKKKDSFKTYEIKKRGTVLIEGLAIGEAVVAAPAQVIKSLNQIDQFKEGSILVTEMTSPDWVPIMEKAAGIITDHGGRTSHAAIVSRELGVPAIVGTHKGTSVIKNEAPITLSCAEGDHGYVYEGIMEFEEKEIRLENLPKIKTQIMMNIASPLAAFRWWRLPAQGIGLARMEFIISNIIKIHPMALVHPDRVKNTKTRKTIEKLTVGYPDKKEYFIENLSRGIAKIAAARYPYPVIVRMSDFKTNEYANLIGGEDFEPKEENPMLGFRGASRYYNPRYQEGFALECESIRRVREVIGLSNVLVMIPFCRTLEEADKVLKVMEENGLKRGKNGLEVYVMAEIPSNVILAEEFAERFDGFSIGSNDLTQLVLGVDRDSAELAPLFNERDPAVMQMIEDLIQIANRKGKKVGICGQAPSDHPDFAEFLVRSGIDSISLNPDSIVGVIERISQMGPESLSA
jgi:pyruvate,water dikinase